MAKWSAIPCSEVHNTRREWFDSDGRFRASVRLECSWEDRFKLVCDLYTSTYGPVLSTTSIGYNPRAYPHVGSITTDGTITAPMAPNQNITHIGVDSVQLANIPECFTTDADGEVIASKTTAHVDVQYGRHYSIMETLEWHSKAITQSYQEFEWATPSNGSDLKLLGELDAPVYVYNTAILTRDYVGLGVGANLIPDIKTLITSVNCTNHEEYTSNQLGFTFKKGTLLMLEPEVRPSVDMQNVRGSILNKFGMQGFAVKIRFLYLPGAVNPGQGIKTDENTHNLFWRPLVKNAATGGYGAWDALNAKIPGVAPGPFTPFANNPNIIDHWLIPGVPPRLAT